MIIRELTISPYVLILREIEEGKLNPFDVDIEYLVELFREQAKKLNDAELLIEALHNKNNILVI